MISLEIKKNPIKSFLKYHFLLKQYCRMKFSNEYVITI